MEYLSQRAQVPQKAGAIEVFDLGYGVKLEMMQIAPGMFMMGSSETEEGRSKDETQHRVGLSKGYWIGKYEVIADEVISHLCKDPDTTVRVTVEIAAEFPEGAPPEVVRIVTENGRALKFTGCEFK